VSISEKTNNSLSPPMTYVNVSFNASSDYYSPRIKFTIAFNDPDLDSEELNELAQRLVSELKQIDMYEVDEVNRVLDPNPPEGNKSIGDFLVGLVTAEVSAPNAENLLFFLEDRLSGETVELSLESYSISLWCKIRIEANVMSFTLENHGCDEDKQTLGYDEVLRVYIRASENFIRTCFGKKVPEDYYDGSFASKRLPTYSPTTTYSTEVTSKSTALIDLDLLDLENWGFDGITRSDTTEFSDLPESSVQNLTRYPNLDCPDKTILNQRFSLTVELLLDQPEDQPEVEGIVINDTGTDKLPEVEVVLSHSGFDLEGSNTQIIEVERDDDSNVRFVLIPRKLGQHKIKVQFYQNGKPIGKSVRNVLVSEQSVTVEVPQPDQPNDIELKTTLTIPPQDLELYIDLADDNRTLSFGLHSVKPEIDYHRTKLGQVTLQGSPLDKMQSVYKEMTQLAQRTPTTDEDKKWAEHRLESVGNELWDELIPERLKQEYWKFKSRVKSVLITSEEPWIPWEMLKPYRDNDDGEQENDLFWCQQFAISRWLSGAGTADELDMKNTRSIAPKQVNLPSVKEEIAFLESLADLRSSVTPLTSFSTRTQVLDSLKNEDLSVLHFACHGLFDSTSPDDSAITLSDGALRPSDIRVKFGGKRQRPLIFINACHGGRAEFSFTGLGGWADRLVNARAGAFIGAMWEVSDKLALQFAKTFYTALLQDNKTTAESFRQAREEIRQLAPYNST